MPLDLPAFTALMPIKATSERLPGKNFRSFDGRPLYHWMLEKLLRCEAVVEILVNTDAPQVAEECAALFPTVRVITRPQQLLGHQITMNSLIAHDIQLTEHAYFLQTHCTNPLLTVATMHRAMRQYIDGLPQYDSLLTVERVQKRLYDAEGAPINHRNDLLLPTQALPPVWMENSNLFLFSRASFHAAHQSRVGLRPQLLEMDAYEGIDIDYEADFQCAEILWQQRSRLS